MVSSFGLIKKHKSLSQREKVALLGPVGNWQCSSQDKTAKSSKQHSMCMSIMTSHKFQKATCGKKKPKNKELCPSQIAGQAQVYT